MITTAPPRSWPRVLRGLAALLVLGTGLVGAPWALVVLAGDPLPSHLDIADLWRTLSTPDDGAVLIRLVALVAWIAWLVFTIAVILETLSLATRRRVTITLPGLGGMQQAVGTLVLLVLAAAATPAAPAAAAPAPAPPGRPAAAAPTDRAATPPAGAAGGGAASRRNQRLPPAADHPAEPALIHVVRPGDDLWTLAEQYYGDGTAWRRIARANPSVLTGGPDRLQPGWRLRVPGVRGDHRRIRVESGDSLSTIAEREYGDAALWTRLYDANRDRVEDPDVVAAGMWLWVPPGPSGDAAPGRATPHRRHDPAPPATDGDTAAAAPASPTSAPASPASAPASPASKVSPSSGGPAPPTAARPGSPGSSSTPVAVGAGDDAADAADAAAGIGGLLAAALLGALLARRRLQLRARPVGRRIPNPPPAAQQFQTALGRRQDRLGLDQLDLALRAIGVDRRRRGLAVPDLVAARVGAEEIRLRWAEPTEPAVVGFTVDGPEWRLSAPDADVALADPTLGDAAQPFPGLVSVGTDADGRTLMVNLESAGMLTVTGGDDASRRGTAAAMVAELASSPWTDEVVVTVVAAEARLVAALDRYNVSRVDGLDPLLDRWERRAVLQRANLAGPTTPSAAVDLRVDPDHADPWVPEIAIVTEPPEPGQADRLRRLLAAEPRATLGAVLVGADAADWRLDLGDPLDPEPRGHLEPLGWRLSPQTLGEPAADAVRELIACTGSPRTEPAPWWAADFGPGDGPAHAVNAADGPDRPDLVMPDTVMPETATSDTATPDTGIPDADPAGPRADTDVPPAEVARWPSEAARVQIQAPDPPPDGSDSPSGRPSPEPHAGSEEPVTVPNPYAGPPSPAPRHPTVLLLGPIRLVGAAGTPPNRAVLQCIEYCTWLLEHPGSTAQAMAAGLIVAEGTRRSNMSRLRSWLGADDRGAPYLPDAYSGRILLSPLVSSDWHRLQILTANGINRTSTEGLCHALDLVRGAPLADAAPGQWHWAEEMRTDMVSVIRDIGVELSDRALSGSDIELARWAAARSLTAAPQDERLMAARIRTEHRAGNPAEVERLALQVAAGARTLGVDLHPETVDLLQQVMEGRLRARA